MTNVLAGENWKEQNQKDEKKISLGMRSDIEIFTM